MTDYKKNLKKITQILPVRLSERLYVLINFILKPKLSYNKIKTTQNYLKQLKLKDRKKFFNSKKAIWRYTFRTNNIENQEKFLSTYLYSSMKKIKDDVNNRFTDKNLPVLICAVKNDLDRVKMQFEHHKKLGIERFVYIDNMSDDGTFEWLKKQDVDLYQTSDTYSASARNAWFRLIIDIYGYNRWYLVLDSDELLAYPGMEEKNIKSLTKFLDLKRINVLKSFMLDMYPFQSIDFSKNSNRKLKLDDYKFFDTEYEMNKSFRGKSVYGGPRWRVFEKFNENFKPNLTKNPLVYMKKDFFFSVHHLMPYYKNDKCEIFSTLIHYKFLESDFDKIIHAVKKENYAGGSAEYKAYLEEIKEKDFVLSFHTTNSQEFKSSNDLLKINIFDRNFATEFKDLKIE